MIPQGELKKSIESVSKKAMLIGLIGAVICAIVGLMPGQTENFFRTYLQAFIFVFGLAGGSLILLMIHHVAGGRWGLVTRGIMEAGTKTLPITLIMFIPLICGMKILYGKWVDPAGATGLNWGEFGEKYIDVIQGKAWYLNQMGWIARGVFYIVVFSIMGWLLTSWSKRQTETADPLVNHPMRVLSGAGIVVYILLMTMAGWDWTMSLEPAWFSSMWGPWFFVCQALTTFCMMILVLAWLAKHEPISKIIEERHYHDLGNYCFAGIVLWTYMSFAQFTIIWHANLGEEISWYLLRREPTWISMTIFLALFHFLVPFFLLMSRFSKRRSKVLCRTVVFILIMRLVDNYWVIGPTFQEKVDITLLDILLPISLTAIWFGVFLTHLKSTPLLAKYDTRFETDLKPVVDHG